MDANISLESLPCADKLPFDSRESAGAAAVYAGFRYAGTKPHPYKCRYCDRWHLSTHVNQNEEP